MKPQRDAAWMGFFLDLSQFIDSQITVKGNHSGQVADLARQTARKVHLPSQQVEATFWASMLHDIGKISVPQDVLSKHGPLDRDEWQFIRMHPTVGANIVRSLDSMAHVAPIIEFHQEKFDGSGYPNGLRGQMIPLSSRILAVADAYDAMTNHRVYREALSKDAAIRELKRSQGRHFDPEIVEAFLTVVGPVEMPLALG